MAGIASSEAPQDQRRTYPAPVHASSPAMSTASQGAQSQPAEAAFQLQYVSMTSQPPQQNQAMYPVYMPAGPVSSPINMGQMAQALPLQLSAQSGYLYPHQSQQQQQQHHRGRNQPAMVPSRGTFTTAPPNFRRQFQAPAAGSTHPQSHQAAYPSMAHALMSQFPSFQSFQHSHYYYPDSASGPATTNAFFIPSQVPGSQIHGHYIDPAYTNPQMVGTKPFGTPYTSGSQSIPSQSYGMDVSGTQSISRGPPRKPRQSGHALWVGNLPPGASVIDLKDHFSREATGEIESVKLISKSNCAFVNYKTQAACVAAMQRFHDSRFYGIRLVCRLRRTSAPSTSSVAASASPEPDPGNANATPLDGSSEASLSTSSSDAISGTGPATRVPARYFILKSLTLQDLEASISTGLWATQAHNEEALNAAYKSADDVYLIFSANKSGEYFGFARMASSIPAPDLEENERTERVASSGNVPAQQQSPQHMRNLSLSSDMVSTASYTYQQQPAATEYAGPRSIATLATEWAPKGRIIDDLARGTIFWEADDTDLPEDVTSGGLSGDGVSGPNEVLSTDESIQVSVGGPSALRISSNASPAQYPIIVRSPIDGSNAVHLPLADPSSSSSLSNAEDSANSPVSRPASASASALVVASSTTHPRRSQAKSGSQPPASLQHSSSSRSQFNSSSGSDDASSRGNPFRIEWLSTRRVPFYRTRGLRNALNNNREVKIARDGTEVEGSVGGRLLVLFGGALSAGPVRIATSDV